MSADYGHPYQPSEEEQHANQIWDPRTNTQLETGVPGSGTWTELEPVDNSQIEVDRYADLSIGADGDDLGDDIEGTYS